MFFVVQILVFYSGLRFGGVLCTLITLITLILVVLIWMYSVGRFEINPKGNDIQNILQRSTERVQRSCNRNHKDRGIQVRKTNTIKTLIYLWLYKSFVEISRREEITKLLYRVNTISLILCIFDFY